MIVKAKSHNFEKGVKKYEIFSGIYNLMQKYTSRDNVRYFMIDNNRYFNLSLNGYMGFEGYIKE